MGDGTKISYFGDSTKIPSWMMSEEASHRRPAPSMRTPSAPKSWNDAWEAMEAVLQKQTTEARMLEQSLQNTPTPWPPELRDRLRHLSTEPIPPIEGVHVAATGRGMLFLVAPQGIRLEMLREGALMRVAPWGRPALEGWTRFLGESEPLDPSRARPWIWAAWRCRMLMALVEAKETEPLEITVPDFLAYQAARRRK